MSTKTLSLHLTLRWRHDVLALRSAGAEGVAVGALAPIPCDPALAGFVFARLVGGAPAAFAPPGSVITVWRAEGGVDLVEGPQAITLASGDVAELKIGEFVLAASAGARESLPRLRRRRASAVWGFAVAALAHAVAFGLAAQDARASSADDEDAQVDALKSLLASAEQRAYSNETKVVEDATGKGDGREQNGKHGDGRAGGGARAPGEEGKMGDRLGRSEGHGRYAVARQIKDDPDPSTARGTALADAAAFGMIGLLAQGSNVPSATFADDWAHGADALSANGNLWARRAGEAGGEGGLALSGIGEGGGGVAGSLGIGLGRVGTLGHTDGAPGPGLGGEGSPAASGSGWDRGWGWHGSHRTRAPVIRCWGGLSISGRLPPESIQRIVRQNFGRFRACYEGGLKTNPQLAGRVSARFVIGRDGSVSNVGNAGSDIPDPAVTSCVMRAFYGISFPQPEGGIVTVTYPIVFSPE